MRTVRLYGPLAEFLGRSAIEAEVDSPAEAVRMLVANWPDLEQHMANYHYRILWGDLEVPVEADPRQLHYPAGADEDIRIVPIVGGSGGSGIWQTIAGIALIGLAFIPGIGIAAAGAGFTMLGQAAFAVGASMFLGGVAQMLSPTPTLNTGRDSDPRESYGFSGIQNTSRQGLPVPIVFGRVLIGSNMISQGIDTDQVD